MYESTGAEIALRFKRHWAGYYSVIRVSDGARIATIEHSKVQDCCDDPNDWLVKYYKPMSEFGHGWWEFEGDIVGSYRDGKGLAQSYAQRIDGKY